VKWDFEEGQILSSRGLEGGKILRIKGIGRFKILVNDVGDKADAGACLGAERRARKIAPPRP